MKAGEINHDAFVTFDVSSLDILSTQRNAYMIIDSNTVSRRPSLTTTVALDICRAKVLLLYYNALTIVGWPPIFNVCEWQKTMGSRFIGKLSRQTCELDAMSQFVIREIQHGIAYVFSIYTMLSAANEQPPSVMERVFLAALGSDHRTSELYIFVINFAGIVQHFRFPQVSPTTTKSFKTLSFRGCAPNPAGGLKAPPRPPVLWSLPAW